MGGRVAGAELRGDVGEGARRLREEGAPFFQRRCRIEAAFVAISGDRCQRHIERGLNGQPKA